MENLEKVKDRILQNIGLNLQNLRDLNSINQENVRNIMKELYYALENMQIKEKVKQRKEELKHDIGYHGIKSLEKD